MKLEQFSSEDGLPKEWSEGKEERVEAGGRMGKWGLQEMHECFVCLFVFFFWLGGFFFVHLGWNLFCCFFSLIHILTCYSVIRLNFPHPLPQSSIPVGGHTFTKTVSSPLFTATAVPPVLLSKITICSTVWPTISRILCNLSLAVKNNAT